MWFKIYFVLIIKKLYMNFKKMANVTTQESLCVAEIKIYLADLHSRKSFWLVLGLAASLVCFLNDL